MAKTILSNSVGIQLTFDADNQNKYLIDFVSDDITEYYPKKTNVDELIVSDNPFNHLDSQNDKIIE